MVHGFLTLDTVSPAAAQAAERLFADIARAPHHGLPAASLGQLTHRNG